MIENDYCGSIDDFELLHMHIVEPIVERFAELSKIEISHEKIVLPLRNCKSSNANIPIWFAENDCHSV